MSRRRRRNPVENEINWTTLILVGAAGLAAYELFFKKSPCGGTPAGNLFCKLTGCSIKKAACAYVNATSCPAEQCQLIGTVTLPCGSNVPVKCGSLQPYGNGAVFCYRGNQSYISSGGGASGNYTSVPMCCAG